MEIVFSKTFAKSYKKLDPKIKKAFDERIALFSIDEFNPRLHNHGLKGDYYGMRSIAITGDYRAHYRIKKFDVRLFVIIGTHSQLFKK